MQMLLTIAFFAIANVLLTGLMLWQGARWLGAGRPTISRAALAVAGMIAVSAALYFVMLWSRDELAGCQALARLLLFLAASLLQLGLGLAIIRASFRTRFVRALGIWAIGMVPSFLAAVLLFSALKPFVFEAFIVPPNSMAPTVNGWHRTATCPQCGHSLIVPAQDPDHPIDSLRAERRSLGICSGCWKTTEVEVPEGDPEAPDRIFVNKQLKPRRWDIVAYRHPPNPSMTHIKLGWISRRVSLHRGRCGVGESNSIAATFRAWRCALHRGSAPHGRSSRHTR
jgi:hypothetical protein